jgi:hypothetical protein
VSVQRRCIRAPLAAVLLIVAIAGLVWSFRGSNDNATDASLARRTAHVAEDRPRKSPEVLPARPERRWTSTQEKHLLSEASTRSSSPSETFAEAATTLPEDGELRERLQASIRVFYEDLGEQAGFGSEDFEKLIALMTDQMVRTLTGPPGSSDRVAAAMEIAEQERQRRAEVRAAFGASRAEAAWRYQKTLPARNEVEEMRGMLARAGLLLTEEQRREIVTAAASSDPGVWEWPPITGAESHQAWLQETLAKLEQRDSTMAAITRGVLSQEQFHTYELHQAQRRNSLESSIASPPHQAP